MLFSLRYPSVRTNEEGKGSTNGVDSDKGEVIGEGERKDEATGYP